MFYELYIYCKVIFIIRIIYSNFDIKVSWMSPVFLLAQRPLKL